MSHDSKARSSLRHKRLNSEKFNTKKCKYIYPRIRFRYFLSVYSHSKISSDCFALFSFRKFQHGKENKWMKGNLIWQQIKKCSRSVICFSFFVHWANKANYKHKHKVYFFFFTLLSRIQFDLLEFQNFQISHCENCSSKIAQVEFPYWRDLENRALSLTTENCC
jgi:hypothetical protein